MPGLAAFFATPAGAAVLSGAFGLAGSVFGGGQDEVTPQQLPSQWPDLTYGMGRFLSNQFNSSSGEPTLYGVTPFPGQLSPNVNQTILPNVYGNWQPWNAGNMYMADILANKNPVGTEDPRLANMMKWGGTGGPGNNAMSLAMQYGAPSQAGQYVANLAQFGAGSQGMANLMQPFLSGQGGVNYRPPPIPTRQITRNA
jgi:hypothetical protein